MKDPKVFKPKGFDKDHMPSNHNAQRISRLNDQESPHNEEGINGLSDYILEALSKARLKVHLEN